jgi:TRAP-type C4-dicarboxylate transport system permease small subunit
MHYLDKINEVINKGMAVVAGAALICMMFITVLDAFLRGFAEPLTGTFEMVGWLAALTAAFSLGYTQLYKQHVSIDLLVKKLGARACSAVEAFVHLISLALFGAVAYKMFTYAGTVRASGSLSETMKVIYYPWVYLVAIGCLGLVIALIAGFVHSLRECFPPKTTGTW